MACHVAIPHGNGEPTSQSTVLEPDVAPESGPGSSVRAIGVADSEVVNEVQFIPERQVEVEMPPRSSAAVAPPSLGFVETQREAFKWAVGPVNAFLGIRNELKDSHFGGSATDQVAFEEIVRRMKIIYITFRTFRVRYCGCSLQSSWSRHRWSPCRSCQARLNPKRCLSPG